MVTFPMLVWNRPLTRPATAGESAVAVHPLPTGEGKAAFGGEGKAAFGGEGKAAFGGEGKTTLMGAVLMPES